MSQQPTNDHLDDLVEEWHEGGDTRSLTEFMAARLDWTEDDVKRWVADASYRPG